MKEDKEKKCFKCEKILPLSEFYLHHKMLDGHLNKCKQCTKDGVKKREKELRSNPEWLEKERERGREKYHRLGSKKPTYEQKKGQIRRYRQKYPEKFMASKYTEIFLTKVPGFNLHHWSYNQEDWLDIIELTIKDHNFYHRFLFYDQESMMFKNSDGELLNTKQKHLDYLTKLNQNNN